MEGSISSRNQPTCRPFFSVRGRKQTRLPVSVLAQRMPRRRPLGSRGEGGIKGKIKKLDSLVPLLVFPAYFNRKEAKHPAVSLPKANKQSKCRQTYLAASLWTTLRPCRERVMYDGMLCHLLRHTREYNAKKRIFCFKCVFFLAQCQSLLP